MDLGHEHVTGYYVRVKRDGKYQSLDIAVLSEVELNELFKDSTKEKCVRFIVSLVQWIQDKHAVNVAGGT